MSFTEFLPGQHLDAERVPGHWLLLRLGKRVLRPGGVELTRSMLKGLSIGLEDDVVEFGPGPGVTAKMTLARKPRSYTGVERDEAAARIVRSYLQKANQSCLVNSAEETGLAAGHASVVYGEAMLTMQGHRQKASIIAEAARLLRAGGRCGIHELYLAPDTLEQQTRDLIERDLSTTIHVGARPLTMAEWQTLLIEQGFEITLSVTAPMRLLDAPQIIKDEGLGRALLIGKRLLSDRKARSRVLAMREVFRRHRDHVRAVALVGVKR
jgi:phospholipid N-methyltransferase